MAAFSICKIVRVACQWRSWFVDDVKTTLQVRKAMPGRNLCSRGTVRSAQCNSCELTLRMTHGLKAACKAGFLFKLRVESCILFLDSAEIFQFQSG